MSITSVCPLADSSLFKQKCYVNGEWIEAESKATFEVYDPATGKLIGSCPECTAADTRVAIEIASKALKTFRKTTSRERSLMLRRWYNLIIENAEDLAKLITCENGKTLTEARGEVAYAASFVEWFSEEAPRSNSGETVSSSFVGKRVLTLKEPVGVCGFITPWNFPAAMITRKIAPAIAAGCTVVAKSPGETPLTSLALAELAHRADIPHGVINIVTALKNTVEIGFALTSSPAVRKISFTGSTSVGRLLMKQSSDTLKKLSLELGGNGPFIVFDDADLEDAVQGAVAAKFRNSGQACIAANTIYVQNGIYNTFVSRFAEVVNGFKVGRGTDEGVHQGPLIHRRAVDKVHALVQDAESKGGQVIVGGQRIPELGMNFFQPTVICNVLKSMKVLTEEVFGPVAPIFKFITEEEVIEMANGTDMGLAGYVYARDVGRVYRVAEALEVGMVGINTGFISDAAAPFGGVKQSGYGREGSSYGISEYQVIKTMTLGGIGDR